MVYQNVRGLRTKLNEFNVIMGASDADIVFITETWLNDGFLDSELPLDMYKIFRRDRDYHSSNTTLGGGCLIAIKNQFVVTRLDEYETKQNSIEDIWLKIDLYDEHLYVCLVY